MEFPAIYLSANAGSDSAQRAYLTTIRFEYFFLALAALLSAFSTISHTILISLFLLVVLLFGLLIFRFVSQLDRQWYACRALAESIKTSAWKFAMRAHPFDDADQVQIPVRNFLNSLNEIRRTNEYIGGRLDARHSDKDQISDQMMETRGLSVEERLAFYLSNRVQDQRTWYARKAKWNARRRVFWFGFAIIVYALAALALFSAIGDFKNISWIFDVLIVIVASSFGWLQVKKHGELAASYTLTAHEIGSIQGLSHEVTDDEKLSDYVNAAEFAFSREHTQWAARRDFG